MQTQNTEVVPVKNELDFAQSYLYLIEQRFGRAFIFDWKISEARLDGQMIVPSALQGLLENAVKHNAGNQKNPLRIRVRLERDHLSVENDLRIKSRGQRTSGTGLKNLSARYAFLTGKPIEISRDEKIFKVTLPLLKLS